MAECAGAAVRIGQLVGLRLHVIDKLLQRLDRQARVHDEHERIGADIADRCEILHRIVGHLHHGRENRDLRQRGPEQRVAVGGRVRDRFGGDRSHSAGPIFNDELLSKLLAEALPDDPRHAIAVPARGERHDDLDGAIGPALGASRPHDGRRRECGKGRQEPSSRRHCENLRGTMPAPNEYKFRSS